jgi:hypothetical protein
VEASSGNTGNAMSMVAAVKGYRMLVIMPDGMSGERLAISRAFGAQVMTLGDFHVNDALAKAREIGRKPGHFAPQQFDSEWNVEENRIWLGPEILAQLPDGVVPDAVVGGVGTGGTETGTPDLRAGQPSPGAAVVRGRGDQDRATLLHRCLPWLLADQGRTASAAFFSGLGWDGARGAFCLACSSLAPMSRSCLLPGPALTLGNQSSSSSLM